MFNDSKLLDRVFPGAHLFRAFLLLLVMDEYVSYPSLLTSHSVYLLMYGGAATQAEAEDKFERLAQYKTDSSIVKQYMEASIDGARYAVILSEREALGSDYHPFIYVFRLMPGEHQLIASIDLQGDIVGSYTAYVKNNAISIRQDTAHQGVYFSEYRFRKIGDEFKLVGIESQSMVSNAYGASEKQLENPDFRNLDIWSGSYTDFLSSRIECWERVFDAERSVHDYQESEKALNMLHRGKRPGAAKHGTTTFPPEKLALLNGFDFYAFSKPSVCYFDYKGKFHSR